MEDSNFEAQFWPWLKTQARKSYAWIGIIGLASQAFPSEFLSLIRPRTSVLDGVADWIPTATHAIQAAVILAVLAAIYRPLHATLKAGHHPGERRPAHASHARQLEDAQSEFYAYWRYLWASWFLLYVTLAGFSFATQSWINREINDPSTVASGPDSVRIVADGSIPPIRRFYNYCASPLKIPEYLLSSAPKSKVGRRDAGDVTSPAPADMEALRRVSESDLRLACLRQESADTDERILGSSHLQLDQPQLEMHEKLRTMHTLFRYRAFAENLFNNLQTVSLFLAYYVLAFGATASRGKAVTPPTAYGLTVVALAAALELFGVMAGVGDAYLDSFASLSALAGGTAMALLVSRLESRRFDGPPWLIALLYLYAVLQVGWVFEGRVELLPYLRQALYVTYLFLKLLFFGYVTWLLESGLMLYYFNCTIENQHSEIKRRNDFFQFVSPRFQASKSEPQASHVGRPDGSGTSGDVQRRDSGGDAHRS